MVLHQQRLLAMSIDDTKASGKRTDGTAIGTPAA
jgi:hypothetical protein